MEAPEDPFPGHETHLMGYSPDFEECEGEIGSHSPEGALCDIRGTPREELATPRCLLFAGRSLLFEPCELGGTGHEEPFERREAGGTRREELFAPLEAEIVPHFLGFGRLEAWGTPREVEGMRLEGQGTWREARGAWLEKVFAGREVPSGWEEDGGMRLAGLVARRLVPELFDN
jgi:hypothetical protein